MASTIPGGDILSGALNVIAQSLLLPVMILLIIFIIFAVIEIGSLLAEYTSRVKITAKEKDILVKSIAISKSQEEMCEIINNSKLTKNDKALLCTVATLNNEIYSKPTREIIAKNLLDEQEIKISKSLERTDIVAKLGSGLGLLGTIIPMGPGLGALGNGDMQTLTSNLTVAFNTTTVGLTAGSICYVVSKIRRRWYEEEMNALYDIATTIIEVEL